MSTFFQERVWKTCSPIALRNTISYLTENLYEIDLLYFDDRYSILYSVKSQNGEIIYYEGRNPLESIKNANIELQSNWGKIPQSIRDFYEWFSNDQPHYNVNFWDVVDEWIVIGFQDE
ncbi:MULTISPECIES: hypothetical protein [Paenibacillus]|uniref:hypothetical protein n=1 Tax=Paenibacillus TaxID=44249 RepID=UPI002FDF456F